MKLLDLGLAEKGLTGEKEKSAYPKKVESTFQSILPLLPNCFACRSLRRHQSFEFFKPVEDDVDQLSCCGQSLRIWAATQRESYAWGALTHQAANLPFCVSL